MEIELYKVQNLPVDASEIAPPDNAKVIELLEKSPTGIFPMLDAQCKMPKGSDTNFNLAICKQHATQPHFASLSSSKVKVKKTSNMAADEVFVIRHFAGDVVYSSITFLEKNTDAFSPVFEELLNKSTRPLVVQVVSGVIPPVSAPTDDAGLSRESSRNLTRRPSTHRAGDLSARGTRRPSVQRGGEPSARGTATPGLTRLPSVQRGGEISARGRPQGSARGGGRSQKPAGPAKSTSVSKKFLLGLKRLMNEIATTHPFFIRCIKPNQTLKPHDFTVAMVLAQMERSGTIECVKLMQAGFPSRAPYAELQTRFKSALPEFMMELEPQHFVEFLLLACDCQPGEYQLGVDMVFFRASKGGVLQELMLMRKDSVLGRIISKAQVAARAFSEGASTAPAAMSAAATARVVEFLPKLEAFQEQRRQERARIRAVFEGAVLAALQMSVWVEAAQVAMAERWSVALRIQTAQRGRSARLHAQQKRRAAFEKKMAADAARKAADEAAAAAAAAAAAEQAGKAEAEAAARLAAAAAAAAAAEAAAAAHAQERAEQDATEMQVRREAAAAAAAAAADERATQQASALQDESDDSMSEASEPDKWFVAVTLGGNVGDLAGQTVEVHQYFMCKGVEWGFQYHNFYGDWELSAEVPIYNGRPHYVHTTMYGGQSHLYNMLDPNHNLERWVIGPAPGGTEAWAFCDDDAATVDAVKAMWTSWDGYAWAPCKKFRFVPKEFEEDGLDSEEDVGGDDFEEDEADLMNLFFEGDETPRGDNDLEAPWEADTPRTAYELRDTPVTKQSAELTKLPTQLTKLPLGGSPLAQPSDGQQQAIEERQDSSTDSARGKQKKGKGKARAAKGGNAAAKGKSPEQGAATEKTASPPSNKRRGSLFSWLS